MIWFAFILGMLPLVLATGAGASGRKSIGIHLPHGAYPRARVCRRAGIRADHPPLSFGLELFAVSLWICHVDFGDQKNRWLRLRMYPCSSGGSGHSASKPLR
jgi:hypothetical protein